MFEKDRLPGITLRSRYERNLSEDVHAYCIGRSEAFTLCLGSRLAGKKYDTPYSVCWLTFSKTPTLASITNRLDPP
jgi:hypothetical protein